MEVRKWLRNVAFATHAMLGGARRQKRARAVRGARLSLAVREVGREARSSKTTSGRKRPNTSRKGFKARAKGRLWRRASVRGSRQGSPREPSRQGRHSVRREWAGRGQEEAL
jgi:hypothetical protein